MKELTISEKVEIFANIGRPLMTDSRYPYMVGMVYPSINEVLEYRRKLLEEKFNKDNKQSDGGPND